MAEVESDRVGLMSRPPVAAAASSEQELILRGQRYEAEALADLYDENFEVVYRYLDARLGEAARAEEMSRRVFLQALESLPKFRRYESGFTPWLLRIANRLLAEEAKAEGAFAESLLPPGAPREAVLRQALRSLTPEQAEVLALRVLAGMTVTEIASATGRRPAAVEALQHRALLGLRRALERQEAV